MPASHVILLARRAEVLEAVVKELTTTHTKTQFHSFAASRVREEVILTELCASTLIPSTGRKIKNLLRGKYAFKDTDTHSGAFLVNFIH